MKQFPRRIVFTVLGLFGLFVAACGANAPLSSNSGTSDSVALAYDPADGSLLKADQSGLVRWQATTGWAKVQTPQTSNLSGIIINPDKPETLYLSGVGLGIARSDDGGIHWRTLNAGLPSLEITALAVHSFRRDTLFAWVRGQGVFRTENGGSAWTRLPDQGPPDTDVRGLIHSTLPGSMNTGWLYADTPTGAYLSMDCF